MCERNRRRHQLWRFVACKTKHQSLIACPLFGRAFPVRSDAVDSLFDVTRLLAHFANYPAGIGVKNTIAVNITDVANASANALLKIKLCVTRNFAGQHYEVSLGEGFASHATQRVLFETG